MQEVPSQPRDPPVAIQEPDYPFQKLYADIFEVRAMQYIVVVYRYLSWPMVYQATDLYAGELVSSLHRTSPARES